MSRRSNRPIALRERDIQRIIDAAVARRFTPPQGAKVTPIGKDVIQSMYQQTAPQGDKTSGMWQPGAPIAPIPGMAPQQGPRAWQYPVGYNIGQLPRSTEMTSFATLRNLAALYEVIPMCEQVWFDLCSKPELVIKPKAEYTVDAQGDPLDPQVLDNKYKARIAKWKAFFAKPDPDNDQKLKPWMQMALKEKLEVDALAIYKHKNRGGGIYGLEIIDGTYIKPLLNERGRKPTGDFPAYEQYLYGVPAMFLRRDELIYSREVERIDSPYGFSRVEKIILRVNQALRKENRDLTSFTDGSTPAGFLEPPGDGTVEWTPEDLMAYQQMWDGLLAGNDAIRARVKVIPPGSKYSKTDSDDIQTPFDLFLATVTAGNFGVPISELSFTEHVNKSSGETQEAMVYRRAMAPIMDSFAAMFTEIMEEDGETELEADWKGFEEPEDFKTRAEGWDILVKNGTQSTSQAAEAMGLKALVQTTPFIVSPTLGPVFIEDVSDPELRQNALDAKKAGYQFSKDNPGGPPQNEQGASQPAKGTASTGTNPHGANGGGTANAGSGAHGAGRPGSNATRGAATDAGIVPADDGRAITAELRRWRDVAVKCVEQGKPQRPFVTNIISEDMQARILHNLAWCKTPHEIRTLFDLVRADVPPDAEMIGADPLLEYDAEHDIYEPSDTAEQLARLAEQGTHITWDDHPSASGVCAMCAPNVGKTVTIGERFPSGHRLPQCHNGCQCTVTVKKG